MGNNIKIILTAAGVPTKRATVNCTDLVEFRNSLILWIATSKSSRSGLTTIRCEQGKYRGVILITESISFILKYLANKFPSQEKQLPTLADFFQEYIPEKNRFFPRENIYLYTDEGEECAYLSKISDKRKWSIVEHKGSDIILKGHYHHNKGVYITSFSWTRASESYSIK